MPQNAAKGGRGLIFLNSCTVVHRSRFTLGNKSYFRLAFFKYVNLQNMAKTDSELLKLYLKELPEMMGEFGSIEEMPDEYKKAITGTMLFAFFRVNEAFKDFAKVCELEFIKITSAISKLR